MNRDIHMEADKPGELVRIEDGDYFFLWNYKEYTGRKGKTIVHQESLTILSYDKDDKEYIVYFFKEKDDSHLPLDSQTTEYVVFENGKFKEWGVSDPVAFAQKLDVPFNYYQESKTANNESLNDILERNKKETQDRLSSGQEMEEFEFSTKTRSVVYRSWSNIPMTNAGRISFRIFVNRKGDVVHCHIIEEETTIKDPESRMEARKAAAGYRFSATTEGFPLVNGVLRFNIRPPATK
jgi:hypothetical protein